MIPTFSYVDRDRSENLTTHQELLIPKKGPVLRVKTIQGVLAGKHHMSL